MFDEYYDSAECISSVGITLQQLLEYYRSLCQQ